MVYFQQSKVCSWAPCNLEPVQRLTWYEILGDRGFLNNFKVLQVSLYRCQLPYRNSLGLWGRAKLKRLVDILSRYWNRWEAQQLHDKDLHKQAHTYIWYLKESPSFLVSNMVNKRIHKVPLCPTEDIVLMVWTIASKVVEDDDGEGEDSGQEEVPSQFEHIQLAAMVWLPSWWQGWVGHLRLHLCMKGMFVLRRRSMISTLSCHFHASLFPRTIEMWKRLWYDYTAGPVQGAPFCPGHQGLGFRSPQNQTNMGRFGMIGTSDHGKSLEQRQRPQVMCSGARVFASFSSCCFCLCWLWSLDFCWRVAGQHDLWDGLRCSQSLSSCKFRNSMTHFPLSTCTLCALVKPCQT